MKSSVTFWDEVWVQEFKGFAVFSKDPPLAYRYSLIREWDQEKPRVLFIMLNPSVATAERSDPTITRCSNFAHLWEYGSMEVVNLFAYVTTDPRKLIKAEDPIGPLNDEIIQWAIFWADIVVAAWGTLAKITRFRMRSRVVSDLVTKAGKKDLYCFKSTNDGEPSHPLYLPGDLKPRVYLNQGEDRESIKED